MTRRSVNEIPVGGVVNVYGMRGIVTNQEDVRGSGSTRIFWDDGRSDTYAWGSTTLPSMDYLGQGILTIKITLESKASKTNKEIVIEKVKALVDTSFKGDYQKAFDYYDMDHDGKLNKDELMTLFTNAEIGNWLTRSIWAREAIEALDLNKDGGISWEEFQKAVKHE